MENTQRLPHYLFLFAAMLLLWLLLTGSLAAEELAAGLVVAALVTLISGPYLSILDGIIYQPRALISVFIYLMYFFKQLVIANFDMARRVLSPSLPISPEIVEISTELQSDLGQLLLANSITLTPGTLSVDLVGNRILVHWIAAPDGVDLQLATREIAAGFEKHISGFLR